MFIDCKAPAAALVTAVKETPVYVSSLYPAPAVVIVFPNATTRLSARPLPLPPTAATLL